MKIELNNSRLEYISKINSVQDYIERHLEEELTVKRLAEEASFSSFHFQRIYKYMTGESLYGYVKRLRLEKAAYLLLSDNDRSIQDIALSMGFSNQASFAKAFKMRFNKNASQYRTDNSIHNLAENNNIDNSINGKVLSTDLLYTNPKEIHIDTINDTEVIYTRYTGSYKGDVKLFETLYTRLYEYVASINAIDNKSKWYAVYHDYGNMTDEDKLRLSVCVSSNTKIKSNIQFGNMLIQGGRYVIGRFKIAPNEYQLAWNFMFGKWLPESGYKPDERMAFEYFPREENNNVEEHTVDIYIPITPL